MRVELVLALALAFEILLEDQAWFAHVWKKVPQPALAKWARRSFPRPSNGRTLTSPETT